MDASSKAALGLIAMAAGGALLVAAWLVLPGPKPGPGRGPGPGPGPGDGVRVGGAPVELAPVQDGVATAGGDTAVPALPPEIAEQLPPDVRERVSELGHGAGAEIEG